MASAGGGPIASVGVGTDVLAAVARPTDAVKQLRREIAAAERELVRLVAAGDKAGVAALSARITTMQAQRASVTAIADRQRKFEDRTKRALDAGYLFKSVAGASAIRSVLRGEFDVRGAVNLAIMSEQTIVKVASKLGGVKFSNFSRGLLRAAPLLAEGVDSIVGGLAKRKQVINERKKMSRLFAAGKISWEEANLYGEQLDKFYGGSLFSEPATMAQNIGASADKMVGMTMNQRENIIAKARYRSRNWGQILAARDPVAALVNSKNRRIMFDSKAFSKRYSEQLIQARNQGLLITDSKRREIIGAALVDQVSNSADREKAAAAIYEALSKFEDEQKDDGPVTVRQKFKLDETKRREAVEAKRWVIPSRLEF